MDIPGLFETLGLLGFPGLLGLTCRLKEPGLPWSVGLSLNPGLVGTVCLNEMFCLLLFCLLRSFLLIGAPTSSGVLILLLKFFAMGLFVFWLGVFDGFLFSPELYMFLEDSLGLILFVKFLGFAISWIGGFAGILKGGVVILREFFLSWLKFCDTWGFVFLFVKFALDCELLTILGLLKFLGWFEIIFTLSGLFKGFVKNGLLFELSWKVLPFFEDATEVLSSLFFLKLSFLIEGLLIESIFLSEFFLFMRFFIFFASSALIELLWLFTEIESFWAASNISLFSRFKSLESS